MYRSLLILLFCLLPFTFNAHADILDWQNTNIQLLRGNDYQLGQKQRSIMTLEHVHGHKYGDTFGFLDIIKPDGGDHTILW